MKPQLDDPVWLEEQYATRTLQSIADELEVCRNTVRNRFVALGITMRSQGAHFKGAPKSPEQRAKMSAARRAYWDARPDRTEFKLKMSAAKTVHGRHPLGYVWEYIPGRGRVLKHRLVVERIIGRILEPDEHVHHINGVVDDNRPENLQLLSHSEHATLHNADRSRDALGRFAG